MQNINIAERVITPIIKECIAFSTKPCFFTSESLFSSIISNAISNSDSSIVDSGKSDICFGN